MAKGTSEQFAATKGLERAWGTFSYEVTQASVDGLFTAAWRETKARLENQRSTNPRNPDGEPDPQTDEVTTVDLLRWAAEKPETVLGRAAKLVWFDTQLETYEGLLRRKDYSADRAFLVARNADAEKNARRLPQADTRAKAIREAIKLLRQKGATRPPIMDERSAEYAQLLEQRDPGEKRNIALMEQAAVRNKRREELLRAITGYQIDPQTMLRLS